ncbi:MAG: S49 family peptidase [Pyrinomonadaceae bacterium]
MTPIQFVLSVLQEKQELREGDLLLILDGRISIETAFDIGSALQMLRTRNTELFIVGFSETLDLSSALILSFCDERISNPFAGPISFNHSAIDISTSDLFKKLGLDVLIELIGAEKSGPEFFDTSMNRGPAMQAEHFKEMRLEVLKIIQQNISTVDTLQDWYACSEELISSGLLTHTLYYEGLWGRYRLRKLKRLRGLYQTVTSSLTLGSSTRSVWVINLENKWIGWLGPSVEKAATTFFRRKINSLPEAVIFVVNHNGGSLQEADRFFRFVEIIGRHVPIFVWVRRAISSGYLMSCVSKEIGIGPLGRIGGIGVYSAVFDATRILDTLGVRIESLGPDRTIYAGAFVANASDGFRQSVKQKVEAMHEYYLAVLKSHRHLSNDQINLVKKGDTFLGQEGVTSGLADKLTDLPTFISSAIPEAFSRVIIKQIKFEPRPSVAHGITEAWRYLKSL